MLVLEELKQCGTLFQGFVMRHRGDDKPLGLHFDKRGGSQKCMKCGHYHARAGRVETVWDTVSRFCDASQG